MHSISTRATTLGRRRNIAIVVAAAGLATAGLSTSAFATTAPTISVQALSSSVPVGGTTVVSLDIHNTDALSVSLTALNLALACTTTSTVPCTSGIDIFKVNSITVDRHLSTPGPTACISDPATWSGTNPDANSNTIYTNPNFEIAANSDCVLDISMTAQNPVGASGATVFFSAQAVLNDSTAAANAVASPVASSQLTVLPAERVTPPAPPAPPVRPVFPPPPARFPEPEHRFHRDAPRCSPETPNNGNGNVGYGNNGNGNNGNCNNGNGNTGDNNNGNGNGFGDGDL